jgi:hypothetical protein
LSLRCHFLGLGLSSTVRTQQIALPPAATLFQNVRIFDGSIGTLSASSNLLVKGKIIEQMSTGAILASAHATVIMAGLGDHGPSVIRRLMETLGKGPISLAGMALIWTPQVL